MYVWLVCGACAGAQGGVGDGGVVGAGGDVSMRAAVRQASATPPGWGCYVCCTYNHPVPEGVRTSPVMVCPVHGTGVRGWTAG